MTGAPARDSLAFIIRGQPYAHRVARADLDLALAAAALDFGIELYFVGPALMQLAADRDSNGALLPAGYRGWAALPELAEVQAYAEGDWLERCERSAIRLLLPLQPLDAAAMRVAWRQCRYAWVV